VGAGAAIGNHTAAVQGAIPPAMRPVTPTPRQVKDRFDDNTEAVDVLKKSAPIGVFFLIAYILIDSRTPISSGTITVSPYHWLALATVMFFFGLTWMPGFQAHWRFWSLACCILLISLMIATGGSTGEVTASYLTIVLCPFATASFVVWGWRWQLTLVGACLVLYVAAEVLMPHGRPFELHRMLGLVAALTLSQVTAVFLERYRRRSHRQMMELAEAAAFRESQIATMTHDIRNPLATLVGLVTLLMDEEIEDRQHWNLLNRVWSTTASMDLLVKNVLDLYLLEEQRLRPNRRMIDPNAVVAETAEQIGIEARLEGLKLRVELGSLPRSNLDPLHLERIVANLLAGAIKRTDAGTIAIRTFHQGGAVMIEVSDSGPDPSAKEMEAIFERPQLTSGVKSPSLIRYIASALVQANGGMIEARATQGGGLTLTIKLPNGGSLSEPSLSLPATSASGV
jgi:signal transduction histidine kinase